MKRIHMALRHNRNVNRVLSVVSLATGDVVRYRHGNGIASIVFSTLDNQRPAHEKR